MKDQYTAQDIVLFFEQFKELPEYLSINDLVELLNNPKPVQGRLKINRMPPKGFLFTAAFLAITIATIATLLIISPGEKEFPAKAKNANDLSYKQPELKSSLIIADTLKPELDNFNPSDGESALKQEAHYHVATQDSLNLATKEITPIISGKDAKGLKTINGNQFILDLSFDELKKLGFDIRHHMVFYRNTYHEANCIFYSSNQGQIWYGDGISEDKKVNNYYAFTSSLQRDSFPANTEFHTRESRDSQFNPKENSEYDAYYFRSVSLDFYPVYSSSLSGEISGLKLKDSFNSSTDTLVPVVIRFSRLRCDIKQDLIFWFRPTSSFFDALPETYQDLRKTYNQLIELKEGNSNADLVAYSIEDWVNEQILPAGTIVDGSGFIVRLSDQELQKIGLFKGLEYNTTANFRTPWGGVAIGGEPEFVTDGPKKGSILSVKYDTVVYSDYSWKYGTDLYGNSLGISTTGKLIGKFLIDNDVLLPVVYDDRLLWFTLSDSLWKLLPERYHYLKAEYDRFLFNRSMIPDLDFVVYFKDGLQKIDMNVTILDLHKNELEDIGFQFNTDHVSIDLVYEDEWMQYIIKDGYYNLPERAKARKTLKPENFLQNNVFDLARDTRYSSTTGDQRNQYDSLITTKNSGYHVLIITDTSGHNLHRIETNTKFKFIEQDELKHLIPVRVSLNKYFRDYSEEKIFWFTPTEEFFNRLPDRYKMDIITEYNCIHENKESSGCTYFEECRSTLELIDFQVFPNPAKNHITISVENLKVTRGKISLVSINGTIVKELLAEKNFSTGNIKYEFELGEVGSGVYLVTLQTADGIKAKRLIVNE